MPFLPLDLMLPALWSLIVLLPPIILEMLLPHSLCSHNPPDPIDLFIGSAMCPSKPWCPDRPPFSGVVESSTEGTPTYGRTSAFLSTVTLGWLALFMTQKWKWKSSLTATPWTVVHWSFLSMGPWAWQGWLFMEQIPEVFSLDYCWSHLPALFHMGCLTVFSARKIHFLIV